MTDMFDFIDKDIIKSVIMLLQSGFDGLALVVEGKGDLAILEHHVQRDSVTILSSFGKDNALSGAKYVVQNNISQVLFLIDLDYDIVQREKFPSVIFSQNHDLFMDLMIENIELMFKVIGQILVDDRHNYTKESEEGQTIFDDRINKAKNNGKEVVDTFKYALDISGRLAAVRIASQRHKLQLNLSKFPFGNLKSESPSSREIAEIILRRSNGATDVDEIAKLVPSSVFRDIYDETSLCYFKKVLASVCDHDFIKSLCFVISRKKKGIREDYVRNMFLSNLLCGDLNKVDWFNDLSQRSNRMGFQAFSCPLCREKSIEYFQHFFET